MTSWPAGATPTSLTLPKQMMTGLLPCSASQAKSVRLQTRQRSHLSSSSTALWWMPPCGLMHRQLITLMALLILLKRNPGSFNLLTRDTMCGWATIGAPDTQVIIRISPTLTIGNLITMPLRMPQSTTTAGLIWVCQICQLWSTRYSTYPASLKSLTLDILKELHRWSMVSHRKKMTTSTMCLPRLFF